MNDLEKAYYSHVLQHHGILGQRWGKRNGPPYPLGASDHSASERRAGWRKSLDKADRSRDTKSSSFRPSASMIDASKAKVNALLKKKAIGGYGGTDHLTNATSAKNTTDSSKSSRSIVGRNPGGYTNNCKDVSLTTCYAHLGHGDLKARAKSFNGNLTDFMEDRFENAKVNYITANSSNVQERLNKQILKKCSEGDTGIVGVSFDPKYLKVNAPEDGHAFNFFVEEGKVVFKDGQPDPPTTDASKWFRYLDETKEVEWVKIDDALIPKEGALEKSMR